MSIATYYYRFMTRRLRKKNPHTNPETESVKEQIRKFMQKTDTSKQESSKTEDDND